MLDVSKKAITMKNKSKGETYSVPHGLVIWSTGVGSRPLVRDFMEQIGQVSELSILPYLRYAHIGDHSTSQKRIIIFQLLIASLNFVG